MPDYTLINTQYNTANDASPNWAGTALTFSGSSGANELRFAVSGGGATGATPSASWPLATKPPSGTAVFDEAWAFTANTTGSQITTYNGTNTNARVLRFNFDNTGTMASAPIITAYDSSAHNAASPGTQPSIINGSSDTSNTSYLKINAYGSGAASGGSVQQTPSAGSVGSAPTATSGTAGAAIPASTPAWLTSWQSAQATSQYIQAPVTPQATFAFQWYWTCALFFGANISASTYTFVVTLQYTFS